MAAKTVTEVSAHSSKIDAGRYLTVVVEREDWADVPENGIYAGKSYRRTTRYAGTVEGYRHVMLGSSSAPWEG